MPVNQLWKFRRGTAAQWTSANSVLADGELGLETDTKKFKFGDGTTPWNSLAYAPGGVTYSSGTNVVVDRATNLAGGAAGRIPYQSSANTTTFVSAGTTTGQSLVWSGSAPVWAQLTASPDYFQTAGTSSAQFAQILSDATGNPSGGYVVLSKTPTLITPTITSGINFSGSTSGTVKLQPSATASGILTLPSTTDTVVVQADIATTVRYTGSAPSRNLDLSTPQVTTITNANGVFTLPSATGTLALTTVINGYLKSDGTFGGGSPSTFSANLPMGSNGFATSGGNTLSLPASVTGTLIADSGTQTLTGAKTFSGGLTSSGSTSLSGTTTISGAATLSNASVAINGISGVSTAGNNVLKIASTTGALSAGKVSLTNSADVSGILPVTNGGLGADPTSGTVGTSGPAGLVTARSNMRIFVQQYQPQGTNSSGNGYIAGYTPQAGDIWLW